MKKVHYLIVLRGRLKMVFIKMLVRRLCRAYKVTHKYCCRFNYTRKLGATYDQYSEREPMTNNEVDANAAVSKIPYSRESLFEDEESKDMEFVVGPDGDRWRFPAHQSVMRNNEVFRAMLEGPLATNNKCIIIEDEDGRAFDNFLRYMYGQKVEFRNYDHALATIYVANKYICSELVKTCVIYLDKEIKNDNVVALYRQLSVLGSTFDNVPLENPFEAPSAPPEENELGEPIPSCSNLDDQNGTLMTKYCSSLLYNCLHYIDTNAEELLNTDAFDDLNQSQLIDIVKRDTLRISSEMVLYNALMRWCIQQCKRNRLELVGWNYRRVLGEDLIFCVRFACMSPKEFMNGPARGNLLHDADIAVILSSMQGYRTDVSLSNKLTPALLESISRPRSDKLPYPIPLSDRSRKIIAQNYKLEASKTKKEKKKRNRGAGAAGEDEVRENRCLHCTISVLSCLFD